MVLLEDNIETVLSAIAEVDPALAPPATLAKALAKDLNSRDLILGKAASPAARTTRDRVAEKVPSLAYLIGKVVGILSAPAR